MTTEICNLSTKDNSTANVIVERSRLNTIILYRNVVPLTLLVFFMLSHWMGAHMQNTDEGIQQATMNQIVNEVARVVQIILITHVVGWINVIMTSESSRPWSGHSYEQDLDKGTHVMMIQGEQSSSSTEKIYVEIKNSRLPRSRRQRLSLSLSMFWWRECYGFKRVSTSQSGMSWMVDLAKWLSTWDGPRSPDPQQKELWESST